MYDCLRAFSVGERSKINAKRSLYLYLSSENPHAATCYLINTNYYLYKK